MRWLTNTYNPRLPDASIVFSSYPGSAKDQQWQDYKNWLSDKIIGPPQATTAYSVQQLQDMHMVGVYVNDASVNS